MRSRKPKPTVVLGGETFTTQEAIKKRFSQIRDSCDVDFSIGQPETRQSALVFLERSKLCVEDEAFLRDLSEFHPKLAPKLHGNTIRRAFVGLCLLEKREKRYRPNKTVFVTAVSADGTELVDSFSPEFAARGAIQGVDKAAEKYYSDVYPNARACIEPQIQEFRSLMQGQGCAITGEIGCFLQVDHKNDFKGLVDGFLKENPHFYDKHVPINNKDLFVEEKSRDAFYAYHKKHASLQLLTVGAHLEKTNSSRKRQREGGVSAS